jgi:uncharacterized membrane protein YgcG
MRTIARLVLGLALVMAAVPAAAQQPPPSSPLARWAPWMGCWQVSEESVDDGARLLAELAGTPAASAATQRGAVVCVSPSEQGGATITTLVRDKVVLSETIVADGAVRPVSDSGCTGSQKAEWSALGARVFARAEIACGNQPVRTVSGLAAMVAGPMWLDIQMIESEGRKSLRVRRYRRAATPPSVQPLSIPRDVATTPLGTKLSLAEIAEASQKVPVEALQAAVLELGTGGYDLKAKQLLELDAAGVPDSVIDLMVAMSFPKRFTVDHARPADGGFSGMDTWATFDDLWPYMAMWPYAGMWPYMGDYYYSSFYRARYSPFGYSHWGYYDPYSYYGYYGSSGFVVVDPGPGTPVPTPTGEGRVVDGHGYTRIRRTEPQTPGRVNGNNDGWSTASTGNGSNSSGSGSSGVSSGGYSSGGSGSGDRVAVPRPPGD